MDRRRFLGLVGTGSAALAIGCGESGPPLRQGEPTLEPTEPGGTTAPPLEDRVPRSLTRTSDRELDVALNVLEGRIPEDWTGHGFWMHAVPRGPVPVFVGEGKVVRLDFGPDGVFCRSRLIRTPDHYADLATLGSMDGFTSDGFARSSNALGFRNFPNTALLAMGDRLIATSDAGRPWELDPETLEPVTAVGWKDEWRGVVPGWLENLTGWVFPQHLGTAHAAIDPVDHSLVTVNLGLEIAGSGGFTDLVRWDGEGRLQKWAVVDEAGRPVKIAQSLHQLALTRNHVVLMDTAFLVEIALRGEAEPEPQAPDATLWVIRRSDLGAGGTVTARRVSLPRESVHFHADYDDSQGIVLHVAHNPGADPSEMIGPGDLGHDGRPVDAALHGLPANATDLGAWARVVLDPDSLAMLEHEVVYDERFWGGPALSAHVGPTLPDRYHSLYWASVGFSPELRLQRVEAMYVDHPYREVALEDLPDGSRPSTLIRIDCDAAEVVDHYAFPVGRAGLSPLFVPRQGSQDERDGYLVCAVISDEPATADSSGDQFWVFDAADLAAGPICRLGHAELDMPFTLHTLWMPRIAPRTASYRVSVREDHAEAVARLSAELRQVFETEVFPHFD